MYKYLLSKVSIWGSHIFPLFFSEDKWSPDQWIFLFRNIISCGFCIQVFSHLNFKAKILKYMWDAAHSLHFYVWRVFLQILSILGNNANIDYNVVKWVEWVFFCTFFTVSYSKWHILEIYECLQTFYGIYLYLRPILSKKNPFHPTLPWNN